MKPISSFFRKYAGWLSFPFILLVFFLKSLVLHRINHTQIRKHQVLNENGLSINHPEATVLTDLEFRSSKVNLEELHEVVLNQYTKNTQFKQSIRTDTFYVEPAYNQEDSHHAQPYWYFWVELPYPDTILNVYDYDYSLHFIQFPHDPILYSNIVTRKKAFPGGLTFLIDSYSYDSSGTVYNYGARALEIY